MFLLKALKAGAKRKARVHRISDDAASDTGPERHDNVVSDNKNNNSAYQYINTQRSKVTKTRLYPALRSLMKGYLVRQCDDQISPRLTQPLRDYVFNEMPMRVIQLGPERRLIGQNEIVSFVTSKLAANFINEDLLSAMEKEVEALGELEFVEWDTNLDPSDADAREDPFAAVCQFLFQEFACYAIISHTWIPSNDEIVFRPDFLLEDPLAKSNKPDSDPGFAKLQGFCSAVQRDHPHINLAWIDTLCINKDSSTELDESIQSMYKWYRNASICIAYLSDTTSLKDMAADKWFGRGWTLQELIAPKNMQFYGKDWKRLTSNKNANDKATPKVQKIISESTGIGKNDLLSFDPLNTKSDVPTRMRWAAKRQTTKGEDRAYSLMGIFGVNFSISYGEGPERAFFRLIEAIITTRDTSHVVQVLHWAGRAVSKKVHTSRLIPPGPDCYKASKISFHVAPTLTEPMLLTHLGLRVRLVLLRVKNLIPLEAPPTGCTPLHVEVRLTFGNLPIVFNPPTIILERRFTELPKGTSLLTSYNPAIPSGYKHNFFLGVYTFTEDTREKCIFLPPTSCAFFLGVATPQKNLSIQDFSSSDFNSSAKIDTRDIILLKLHGHLKAGHLGQDKIKINQNLLTKDTDMKVVSMYL